MKFILGKKLGMTTIYDQEKGAQNATLISCEPNKVSLVRTEEKDRYKAVRLEVNKTKNKIHKKEFRVAEIDKKAGDMVGLDVFQVGDKVKISGISKAKGFQGVVKRHGFSGSAKTHGHKHDWRAPGSIGATFPEHVIKGKKMAGHMGGVRKSSLNLEVVMINKEKNIMAVKGPVPGVIGRIVEIIG